MQATITANGKPVVLELTMAIQKFLPETCNEIFSSTTLEMKNIICNMINEYNRAIQKHPSWTRDNDQVHAAAIVAEESGELVRAALQYQYGEYGSDRYAAISEMHTEAVQTGAMCIRFLLNAPQD